MNIIRFMGLFAIIPATLLLALSFFILFALRKTEAQGLKAFGYVIAAFLWVGVLLMVLAGMYVVSTGRHPMMDMMQQMSKQCQGMMSGGSPMQHMMMPAQK